MLCQANIEHLPLRDESVDMIFTDPPYPYEYLQCYAWLAEQAARILKPDRFCMAMCGGLYLPQIMELMGKHLAFHWKFEIFLNSFSASPIWPKKVIARSKPILCYSKGKAEFIQGNVLGAIIGGGIDKRFHHWGQDVDSARYYIEVSTQPGDLVCDPFLGGGTTAVACELIGRRWLGCDIDPAALGISDQRLSDKETAAYRNLPLFQSGSRLTPAAPDRAFVCSKCGWSGQSTCCPNCDALVNPPCG